MPQYETLILETDDRGVARLTLNRPDARNAMSQQMIRELSTVCELLGHDEKIRAVVFTGAGDIFCAGGDIRGFQQQASASRADRIHDASEFAKTLAALDSLPKPVIGRINGSAYGGGVGLVSICDIAIGVESASFRLTEVTLGLIPATISPYVVGKIGVPNSRRMMLNAHPVNAAEARRIGLLSEVASAAELDAVVEAEVAKCLQCAPQSVANCKALIRYVSTHDATDNLQYTSQALADAWESDEIREGVAAFLAKRKPAWSRS